MALDQWLLRNILLLVTFVLLGYVFFREKQDSQLNWALFFSFLWTTTLLLFANWLCVQWGFWSFNTEENLSIFMPFDLYFMWIIFWGVFLPLLLKGRFIIISSIGLFWLDLLFMPFLETYSILKLENHWLLGELCLIFIVYCPAQVWVHLFLEKKGLKWRSLFQFIIIAFMYCLGLPFSVYLYLPDYIYVDMGHWSTPYMMQLAFIILLPGLIAMIDLVQKGKGTPFPYDPTIHLVETGVYAYIRNPIQWSLTFLFIPLALFYHSYVLLVGIIVSIAYTIGISEPHEQIQLKERYASQWTKYKKNVPLWYFLWRPIHRPVATIYFRKNCQVCSASRQWLERKKPVNLSFVDAEKFKGMPLKQVTYFDQNGKSAKSVEAIALALEHINLAYASLAWLMRLPGICQFLQLIIDSMGLEEHEQKCSI